MKIKSYGISLENQLKIALSSNPTACLVSLNITGLENDFNTSAQLSNSTGQSVLNWKTVSNRQELDLSDLPNGVYFLTLQGATFSGTKKVIINH